MMTDSAALARPPIEVVNPKHAPTMRAVERIRQVEMKTIASLWRARGLGMACDMSLIDRINQRVAALGLSSERASLNAGLSRSFLRTLANRPGAAPSADNLAKLAVALGVSTDWLLGLTDDPEPATPTPLAATLFSAALPLRGVVRAGAWLETDEDAYATAGALSDLFPDPRWPLSAQYAVTLQGDSVNVVYPSGSQLRVVDAAAVAYRMRRGDLVVLQRQRGALYELSAKFVERTEPAPVFVGRSTVARWNLPLSLGAAQEDTVRVVALVTGAFLPPPLAPA